MCPTAAVEENRQQVNDILVNYAGSARHRAILIYGQPYTPVLYGRFPTNLTVDLRHHQDHSAPGASSGSSLLLMSVTSPHPALVPLPSRHSSGSPHVTLSGSPLQLNNILFYRNIFICYKSYTNTNIN